MEKQNNNKKKKTVLKISTGHKPLSYRNHKTGKVKEKKSPKRDAQADYHEEHSSQRALKESHIFSLLQ